MQSQSTTAGVDPAWRPLIEAPGPQTGTLAGAIYDRASEPGGYEYAQQTHYEVVRDMFHRHGLYVAMYRYEDRKGGRIDRKGYQDICGAAARREIDAVGVDHMARLGRRGPERLRVLAEFDRLGVQVWVASKDRPDEPGIVRYVEAWQDEEYLKEQARKTISNMPRVIKAGKHPARPPIGYRWSYRFLDEQQTQIEKLMVPDERYGPLVQGVFRDYADGIPIRVIVESLNGGPLDNPRSHDGSWSYDVVRAMLHRTVYLGLVEWGRTHPGEWGRYPGMLSEKGQHTALIDRELWERVQARWRHQEGGARRMNQRGTATELLDGLLVCRGCGGRVYATYSKSGTETYRHYTCAARKRMTTGCREPSISVRLADEAVLAQVGRLRGVAWEPQPFDEVVRRDPDEPVRRRLRDLIAADEEALQANARAFTAVGDFSPEASAAFRKEAQAISLRLRHHKDQLAALPERRVDTVKAKEVHELMMQRDIPTLAANALARADTEVLRDILTTTVGAARIVARGSRSGMGRQATWAKAEVEWTPEVRLLLDAGLLKLAPELEPPAPTTRQELAKERARRYRARKAERAQADGAH